MTREDLIKKVALKMDEISSSDDVIVSVHSGDNNPLYAQINGLLNESINDVLTKAPIYRINSQLGSIESRYIDTETIFDSRQMIVVAVPEDFIRIVSISDEAFERPIVDLAVEGDDVDKRQHNKFLVAKQAKPVAVLGRTWDNRRVIRCYSYGEDDVTNPYILYVKRYSDTSMSSEILFDDYLVDIISWVCAGKVFSAQGDLSKGKLCDENAVSLMV